MNISDLIIYQKHIPRREAQYMPYPKKLERELADYLSAQGIEALYSHQAEMFEEAEAGRNVVITTSTASGKTLSFLLPVLQEILHNPMARAIFIYPTKALASDQYRALEPILAYFGENRISAGVYDGDTPVSERSRIRRSANIILTNPEMVNGAFLPNHSKYGFDFIFSNLKFVVVDEMHTYRGAFGSHLANVFRRLSRVCRYYHTTPQYLCSSATIANPIELAQGICGQPFVWVSQDGSPVAERHYALVLPPKIMGKDRKYYGQMQASGIAAAMIPQLIEEGHSFLAFARSRRNVEVILKEARDKLRTESFFGEGMESAVSGYRGGYTPTERRSIEHRMISGELKGLVSTNALELGIDIGKIDTTVIVGYPATRASFWQQSGRAGRNGGVSSHYLILEEQPFDQYIAVKPEWLFENSSESAVIDPNNLLIELAHIRAAAAELPLTLDDISLFPDLGETIPVLIRASELDSQGGKFLWSGNAFPAGDYSLRNIDKARYKLMNQENHTEITQMDEMQAFREIHDGAIYMHDSMQYQVVKFDRESRTAYAIPFQGNYYTMPGGSTDVRILLESTSRQYERTQAVFGEVNVQDVVFMYKKLQFHNHQNLGFEQLPQPLEKTFDTESVWLRIPPEVVRIYRRLLQETASGQFVRNNHFEGMCYAIKNAAMMATMTEQEDIGTVMSCNAVELSQTEEDEVDLFIYDKYVGGLGFAEKIYEVIDTVIEQAITMVSGCSCENGCAACIGDYRLDKQMVLWGLKNLREQIEPPKDVKLVEYGKFTYIKKEFEFARLADQWEEFCRFLRDNGDGLAEFLGSVAKVSVNQNLLTLYVTNAFYKEWILQENNRRSIVNIVSFYTEGPAAIRIEVEVEPKEEHTQTSGETTRKLMRRYENLTEQE